MNINELFPIATVQMDSPRLAWMKKHGVVTYFSDIEPAIWFAGFQEWWPDAKTPADFFCLETGHHGDSRCAIETTKEEAITKLAYYYHIPLWNEEPTK